VLFSHKNVLVLRGANDIAFRNSTTAVADKEEPIELMGNVTQVLPGMMFRVVLPNGHEA